jgi:hypothetical protein
MVCSRCLRIAMLSISSLVVAAVVEPDTTMPVVAAVVRVWCARERSVSSRALNMRLKLAPEAPVVRILEQTFPGRTERHRSSVRSSPRAAKADSEVARRTGPYVLGDLRKSVRPRRGGAEVAVAVVVVAAAAAVQPVMASTVRTQRVGPAVPERRLRSRGQPEHSALVELAQTQAFITEAHQVRPIPATEVVVADPRVLRRGAEGMVAQE